MEQSPSGNQLSHYLSGPLGSRAAQELSELFTVPEHRQQIIALLAELQETSRKLFEVAVNAIPELIRRCEPGIIIPWLDLTVCLAASSGATTLKYLRESPLILGVLENERTRSAVLAASLEIADGNSAYAPNCAFEFFRKTPELLLVIPQSDLLAWGELGLELAEWDFVLAVEFFKESPRIAEALSLTLVRNWIQLSLKLVTENSLGKPDYVGTLEFFRSSPGLLKDVADPDVRRQVVDLASLLADQSPEHALSFLAEAPHIVGELPNREWQMRVLQYGCLVAAKDSATTLAYFRRCPDVFRLMTKAEEMHEAFHAWFQGGMEVLAYSIEGARAFFSLDTDKALRSITQAMNGVALRQVIRSLQMFARMIAGDDIALQASRDEGRDSAAPRQHDESSHGNSSRAARQQIRLSHDKKTLSLPSLVNRYPTRDENYRWYAVATAHAMGRLAFGTYRVNLESLQDLVEAVRLRYADPGHAPPPTPTHSVDDIFQCYPQTGVIHDIWRMLEDARVQYLLKHEYPGFGDDFARLAGETVTTRSVLHGMTAREMVIDALWLLCAGDERAQQWPEALLSVIREVWEIAQGVFRQNATAEDAIRLADRIYQVLDRRIGVFRVTEPIDIERESQETADLGPGPRAAEEIVDEYRPITNWSYRGTIDPRMVGRSVEAGETATAIELPMASDVSERGARRQGHPHRAGEQGRDQTDSPQADDSLAASKIDQWLHVGHAGSAHASSKVARTFFYDEWDGSLQDYRTSWCRVVERVGEEGTQDFAHATLEKHGPMVRLLRRYFETIRPMAFRKLYQQEDGEEIDVDAIIKRVTDRRGGADSSERVYIRRDTRERHVASAFLFDMSGSTGRHVQGGAQRVIDIEREGMVLLAEALEAIGDQYALYGFSGQGRRSVEFIVLKEFSDGPGYRLQQRIEAVRPLNQNRDGAAIRHAAHKLVQCAARHRLLILISDGRPLDDGYADEYALEDTKMALREARQVGILPFCLTVDREASAYLRRMYGDVLYTILDDIARLPERLPKLYRQLTKS